MTAVNINPGNPGKLPDEAEPFAPNSGDRNEMRYDDEVEMIDLIGVLWKRKPFIIACVLICTLLSVAVSLSMAKIYRVDMVLQPGIIKVREDGENVYIDSLENIKAVIQANTLDTRMPDRADAGKATPRNIIFTFSALKESNTLKVIHETDDIEFGLKAMTALAAFLVEKYSRLVHLHQKDFDNKIRLNAGELIKKEGGIKEKKNIILAEKAKMEAEIRMESNNRARIEAEISSIEAALNSEIEKMENLILTEEAKIRAGASQIENLKKRIEDIDPEIVRISRNTDTLIKERDNILSNGKTGDESLSILVYSNTIHQNIGYLNNLRSQRSEINHRIYGEQVGMEELRNDIKSTKFEIEARKITTENSIQQKKTVLNDLETKKENIEKQGEYRISRLNLEIEDIEKQVGLLKDEVKILQYKKSSVQNIQILREPMKSKRPVKPRKKLIVATTFVLSLFFTVFLAFCFEYINYHKGALRTGKRENEKRKNGEKGKRFG